MISVCIATYNGERYLREQLDSILPQLSEGDEIVISDDGSTDHTVEIIKSYQSEKIILLENHASKSPVSNFENALRHAKNEVIFLADQDDVWENDKVRIMLEHLKSYQLVISDASIIDSEGTMTAASFFKLNGSRPGLLKNLMRNSYIGCTMAFDRTILRHALPFPEETPMHDWWIGLVAELFGKVYFCEMSLVRYRRHADNASASAGRSPNTFIEKLKMRYHLVLNLVRRYLRQ